MAGPKVQFKLTSSSNFNCPNVEYSTSTASQFRPAYSAGQLIFVEDTKNIYLDFHNWRKCYTEAGGSATGSEINYRGISTTNPTSGTVTINGQVISPAPNDMVVFGEKEYLYRQGGANNEYGWYEIGDEEELTWSTTD
jgi:hypothetical protein